MSYKKPQIVAKSAATKSYAAGCPAKIAQPYGSPNDRRCRCQRCEVAGS